MNERLSRAAILLEQSRYPEAEQEARRSLQGDPDNPLGHFYLSIALSSQDRHPEALAEARQIIAIAPDISPGYYAEAMSLLNVDQYAEALIAIREAIRIDPDEPDYYAVESGIHIEQKNWQQALDAAKQGLVIDPEHVRCNNLQAIALTRLGRKEEAGQAIESILSKAPENATSHANMGWTLLNQHKPKKAMESFAEALRLDPNSQWARVGIIEAMKARNPIYALMLRYFLWMGKLKGRTQWIIVLVAYFGYRIVLNIAQTQPKLAPFLYPLLILYVIFVFMTWVSSPLFNLLLRLDKFGRYALSRLETIAANLVGLCLLTGIVLIALTFVLDMPVLFIAGIGAIVFMIPVAGTFNQSNPRSRIILGTYTALLGLIGIVDAIMNVYALDPAGTFGMLFFIGVFLFSWIANFMAVR